MLDRKFDIIKHALILCWMPLLFAEPIITTTRLNSTKTTSSLTGLNKSLTNTPRNETNQTNTTTTPLNSTQTTSALPAVNKSVTNTPTNQTNQTNITTTRLNATTTNLTLPAVNKSGTNTPTNQSNQANTTTTPLNSTQTTSALPAVKKSVTNTPTNQTNQTNITKTRLNSTKTTSALPAVNKSETPANLTNQKNVLINQVKDPGVAPSGISNVSLFNILAASVLLLLLFAFALVSVCGNTGPHNFDDVHAMETPRTPHEPESSHPKRKFITGHMNEDGSIEPKQAPEYALPDDYGDRVPEDVPANYMHINGLLKRLEERDESLSARGSLGQSAITMERATEIIEDAFKALPENTGIETVRHMTQKSLYDLHPERHKFILIDGESNRSPSLKNQSRSSSK